MSKSNYPFPYEEAPLVRALRKRINKNPKLKPLLNEILMAYDEAVIDAWPLILDDLVRLANK
jgi:hypothetical protein